MANATISLDAGLKARLADLASQTGQHVDEFVEGLLRRIAKPMCGSSGACLCSPAGPGRPK